MERSAGNEAPMGEERTQERQEGPSRGCLQPRQAPFLPASPFRADSGALAPAGAAQRQVFGLVGAPGTGFVPGLSTGRHFPVRTIRASVFDGGRSHSPLRDSPGFAPGSLLPHYPKE